MSIRTYNTYSATVALIGLTMLATACGSGGGITGSDSVAPTLVESATLTRAPIRFCGQIWLDVKSGVASASDTKQVRFLVSEKLSQVLVLVSQSEAVRATFNRLPENQVSQALMQKKQPSMLGQMKLKKAMKVSGIFMAMFLH